MQTQDNETKEEDAWGSEVWADDEKVRIFSGEQVQPWTTFAESCGPWKFPAGLLQFIQDLGFAAPTPIQAYCWPALLNQLDVIGVAKTGSGKTLAYLLPGYIKVKRGEMPCDHANGPTMLVMAPTRELCQQIASDSERFGHPVGILTACCYGGAPRDGQKRNLLMGPHCVVATPGRLRDFMQMSDVHLHNVNYFVLDEADRMLDMGFEKEVFAIAQELTHNPQTLLFTATWPVTVRTLAEKLTRGATHIQVGTSDALTGNSDIEQRIVVVRNYHDKMKFLEETLFPELQSIDGTALIFTRTKREASSMAKILKSKGCPITELHGDLDQPQRDRALNDFRAGRAKVMVATDVAQRGLDIKNVNVVVNYDAPGNGEDYVHRIGRTGRAGTKGKSFTLLTANDAPIAKDIAKVMRKCGQTPPQELLDVANYAQSGDYSGKYNSWNDYAVPSNSNNNWGGRYSSTVN